MRTAIVTRRQMIAAGMVGASWLAVPGVGWAQEDDVVTPPVETGGGKVRGAPRRGCFALPRHSLWQRHRQAPVPAGPGRAVLDRACATASASARRRRRRRLPSPAPAAAAMDLSSPAAKTVMAIFADASRPAPESEDCLFLNVFTPDASPRTQAAGDGLAARRRLRVGLGRRARPMTAARCAGAATWWWSRSTIA